mmetsp:Transcript_16449/g.36931  ORF Transcript_16449/g.36931 Transcript_16449/m.36931 type:complete len:85 (-) Transcript_16449:188-442(-)
MMRVRLGFTSNKPEGNSFSELEVQQYIMTGVTIGGKTLTEHAEIESHDRAVIMMFDAVKSPLQTPTRCACQRLGRAPTTSSPAG